MNQRGWYLRRAVPWPAVLGCCVAALAVAAALDRWPGTAVVLLPTVLGCCAAAAAFVFDEVAGAAVAVAPRGGRWRRAGRLGVAALPVTLWVGVVAARPGSLPLDRLDWSLAGLGAITLTAGVAGLASRHTDVPGSALATAIVLVVLAPVVAAGMTGMTSIYPIDGPSPGVRLVWLAVVGGGLATAADAFRRA